MQFNVDININGRWDTSPAVNIESAPACMCPWFQMFNVDSNRAKLLMVLLSQQVNTVNIDLLRDPDVCMWSAQHQYTEVQIHGYPGSTCMCLAATLN